jgi:hypothetical protein
MIQETYYSFALTLCNIFYFFSYEKTDIDVVNYYRE